MNRYQSHCSPISCARLKEEMRLVWEQHVYWTRMLLISIAERLHDQAEVTNRLLRNPADIARIFARYYPKQAASAINNLLTEHLKIGAELITALRDANTLQAEQLDQSWYINADEMAAAFNSINPCFYDYIEMQKMLYTHLDLTKKEVAARLARNYAADIKAFDAVEIEALKMADIFAEGIVKQFPNRFC